MIIRDLFHKSLDWVKQKTECRYHGFDGDTCPARSRLVQIILIREYSILNGRDNNMNKTMNFV